MSHFSDVQPAIDNLTNHQIQADIDGCMVTVSRQALDEVLTAIASAAPGEPCAPSLPKRPFAFAVKRAPENGEDQWRLFMDEAAARAEAEQLDGEYEGLYRVGDRRSVASLRREATAPAEGVTVAAVGKHADQLILAFTAGVEHMRQAAINIAKPWEGAEGFPKVKSDAIAECRRKIVAAIESAEVRP